MLISSLTTEVILRSDRSPRLTPAQLSPIHGELFASDASSGSLFLKIITAGAPNPEDALRVMKATELLLIVTALVRPLMNLSYLLLFVLDAEEMSELPIEVEEIKHLDEAFLAYRPPAW
jgi:hypothetical protein